VSEEHESSAEEVAELRQMVEHIGQRNGEENPLPVGYVIAVEYLDDEGHRLWGIRYDPDQGYGTTLGLAKLIELDTERIARETLGLDGDDGDGA
jgi:hypothetical protein